MYPNVLPPGKFKLKVICCIVSSKLQVAEDVVSYGKRIPAPKKKPSPTVTGFTIVTVRQVVLADRPIVLSAVPNVMPFKMTFGHTIIDVVGGGIIFVESDGSGVCA
jgi:hypothetical protein